MSYLLNIEKEKLKELKLLAAREGTTIKSILEKQIDDYLKVHKEGNPQHLITSSIENNDFVGFPSIATEYSKKQSYLFKNCIENDKLNPFGNELWGHVTQWYHLMEKF